MRKLLMALVVLSICINAAWAGGPKPGSSHPGGSGPKPGGGINKPSGNATKPTDKPTTKPGTIKGNQVKPSNVKPSNRSTHSGNWRGWQKKYYSERLGCSLYWSAEDDCWYIYDEATGTFVPYDG